MRNIARESITKRYAGFRAIVALEEWVFGPMHPDTLPSRNGLAIALDNEASPPKRKLNIAGS